MFRFTQLHLEQYRCFEALDLHLEPDLTVLFAENGGGKTAVLMALAVGLTPFQQGTPRALKLDPQRDVRKMTLDERGRRESAGPCTLVWTADVGARAGVSWSRTANPTSNRKSSDHRAVLDAMEPVRVPGARWPLFAFYGVDRMGRGKGHPPSPRRLGRTVGRATRTA
jgi:predicted ATP-binding protein involved in virulence